MNPSEPPDDPRVDPGSPQYRRALIALFCAALATFALLHSPQGLLPELTRTFAIDADAASWALGAGTLGVAIGVFPWARLSDFIGRVRAMRWSMLAAAALGLVVPLAPTFELFVALRLLEGLALAGLPAIAVTALAETVQPRVLGAAVGSYIAGNTIGGLAGRLLAAAVDEVADWRWGLGAVSVLAAGATIAFVALIPPTRRAPSRGLPIARAMLANARTSAIRIPVLQGFLLMGAFVAAYNFLGFRLEAPPFDLSLLQVSWLFLAYLAGTVSSRLVWRIAARARPALVLAASTGLMVVGIGLTLTPWLIVVIVGLVLFTGAFFAAHSIASGLVGRRASGTEAASQAPPLYNLAYYAGASLLGWLGGVAYATWGWGGAVALIAVAAGLAGLLGLRDARRVG